jgi:hypothetical protein
LTATTALVSALAALVSAVVGPVVANAVGRRQFRATVLSANRHAWINALREDVVEILAKRVELENLLHRYPDGTRVVVDTGNPEYDEIIGRIRRLRYKIGLLLRTGDHDHDRLVELLVKALTPSTDAQLTNDIIGATLTILSKEWERASRGK